MLSLFILVDEAHLISLISWINVLVYFGILVRGELKYKLLLVLAIANIFIMLHLNVTNTFVFYICMWCSLFYINGVPHSLINMSILGLSKSSMA